MLPAQNLDETNDWRRETSPILQAAQPSPLAFPVPPPPVRGPMKTFPFPPPQPLWADPRQPVPTLAPREDRPLFYVPHWIPVPVEAALYVGAGTLLGALLTYALLALLT
jgi:hypothetical protein